MSPDVETDLPRLDPHRAGFSSGLPGDGSHFPRRESPIAIVLSIAKTMWPCSNKAFVPASEQRIFYLRLPRCVLRFANRGGGRFHKHSIFEPGSRSAQMPAAFSMAVG
jgi:hypothetical protein